MSAVAVPGGTSRLHVDDFQERALHTFFGITPDDVMATVVLTPIPAFFRSTRAFPARGAFRGWWPSTVIEHDGAGITIIQHPEGNRITDAVLAVAGLTQRIVLLGLCGALEDGPPLSSIVELASASNTAGHRLDATETFSVERATSTQVEGFLCETPDLLRRSRWHGSTVVDMESHTAFAVAASLVPPLRRGALLYVSDEPAGRPFWSIPLDDVMLEEAGHRMLRLVLTDAGPPVDTNIGRTP